jgi:GntR family transcriptional repressor for pyruvate dehydrogenase complex
METFKNASSLQRKRLYEEVLNELKKAIFSGEYQIGDKLPSETELAKLFHVSRAVIREAIRYLELTGLVTVKQGATGGAFISEMNSQILQTFMKDFLISGKISFSQISEVRMYLDPEIARLAAIHATETDLKELKPSIYLQTDETDKTVVIKQIARFHALLGKSSHNPFYAIISDSITQLTAELTAEFIGTIHKAELLRMQSEHEGIYEAVSAGDPDKAVELTREHSRWMDKRMIEREKAYLERIRR